jgi:hypothetical protein
MSPFATAVISALPFDGENPLTMDKNGSRPSRDRAVTKGGLR